MSYFKILDTVNLSVTKVIEQTSNTPLEFSFGETSSVYGSPLQIDLSSLKTNEK